MDNPSKSKCAHQNCSCTASPDSKYCSPYCETAKATAAISCECGHRGCAGEITH